MTAACPAMRPAGIPRPDGRASTGDRLLAAIAVLALFAGGLLSGRSIYLRAKAVLASVLIRKAWDATLRTGRPVRAWSWADTHPVARLAIPALGYDEIVLEGASGEALAFGPARMMHAATPGRPGNLVLAGHRTSHFRPLERIRVGDRVIVEWFDERKRRPVSRVYGVDEIAIVDPKDTRHLALGSSEILTLVTCHPFGFGARSPRRFIVRARPLPGEIPSEGVTAPTDRSRAGSVVSGRVGLGLRLHHDTRPRHADRLSVLSAGIFSRGDGAKRRALGRAYPPAIDRRDPRTGGGPRTGETAPPGHRGRHAAFTHPVGTAGIGQDDAGARHPAHDARALRGVKRGSLRRQGGPRDPRSGLHQETA